MQRSGQHTLAHKKKIKMSGLYCSCYLSKPDEKLILAVLEEDNLHIQETSSAPCQCHILCMHPAKLFVFLNPFLKLIRLFILNKSFCRVQRFSFVRKKTKCSFLKHMQFLPSNRYNVQVMCDLDMYNQIDILYSVNFC